MPRNRLRRIGEGPSRAPSAPLFRGALILSSALLVSNCGLENVSFYTPPTFQNYSGVLRLTHSTANTDSTFLGYNVYYKAYADPKKAGSEKASVEAALGLATSTPESSLNQIKGLGFKPVYLASKPDNETLPLLSVPDADKSTGRYFSISLTANSDPANWSFTDSTDPSTAAGTEIVRSTAKSKDGQYVGNSFNGEYVVGDKDYDGSVADSTAPISSPYGSTIHFVFFAVAYGYDLVKIRDIYSMPVSLDGEPVEYFIPYLGQ
jgi:hypothetical protein